MEIYRRTLEILERNYRLVAEAPPDRIIPHALAFTSFIYSEPLLEPYTEWIALKFKEFSEQWDQVEAELIENIVELRNKLLLFDPSLSEETGALRTAEGAPSLAYFDSLRFFADLLEDKALVPINKSSSSMEDQNDTSKVGWLLSILGNIIDRKKRAFSEENFPEILHSIAVQHFELGERQRVLRTRQILAASISWENALASLWLLAKAVNPPAAKGSTFFDFMTDLMAKQGGITEKEIRDQVLKGEVDPKSIEQVVWNVRLIYEALTSKIGGVLSHLNLVGRYKSRAMWYDCERLRELVRSPKTRKFVRKREDLLVMDMARWLFDQGLPVLVKPMLGNAQIDSLGVQTPILIEGKAYLKADSNLLSNIAQVFSYFNTVDRSQFHVEEAYYVVFRLDGPLYNFPPYVRYNQHIVYPIVIDLADSKSKGRGQKDVVEITEDMIKNQLKKPHKAKKKPSKSK